MLKRTALLSLCRKHSSNTSKSRLKNFLVNCILLPLIFVGHWILTRSNMPTALKNVTMKLIALGENKKIIISLDVPYVSTYIFKSVSVRKICEIVRKQEPIPHWKRSYNSDFVSGNSTRGQVLRRFCIWQTRCAALSSLYRAKNRFLFSVVNFRWNIKCAYLPYCHSGVSL